MLNRKCNSSARIVALAVVTFLLGCSSKKMAKVMQPTPPPPAAAPTASLTATPDVIQQGQSTVLSWQTSNATDTTIEGLGAVQASGSQSVTPSSSRTYTLMAKGPGGTNQASARITVNSVAARATPELSDADLFARNVKDVYFNFDDARIRTEEVPVTHNDSSFLNQRSNLKVLIEGHCDDRGSEMYNLALGTKRAEAVKEELVQQGIDPSRIKTVSYGKEKPFCMQENEDCWQQNRRDHFVLEH